MSFNPDPSKQAQKVKFSRKTKKVYHSPLTSNNNNIPGTNLQKHLGVVLDNRLSLEDHLKMILTKVNKTIGLFANFIIFYQDLHCSLYTNNSLDLISITVTLYMTKLITHHFIKNYNLYSTMLASQ